MLQTCPSFSVVDVHEGYCLDTDIQHEGGEDPIAQQESRDLGSILGYVTWYGENSAEKNQKIYGKNRGTVE